MTDIERAAEEVRRRQANLLRYRQAVKDHDEPHAEERRRGLEIARQALEEADDALALGRNMVKAEEAALAFAYAEYFRVANAK